MEKKIDALKASSLSDLVEFMNREKIKKEDVVQLVCTNQGEFVVLLYK